MALTSLYIDEHQKAFREPFTNTSVYCFPSCDINQRGATHVVYMVRNNAFSVCYAALVPRLRPSFAYLMGQVGNVRKRSDFQLPADIEEKVAHWKNCVNICQLSDAEREIHSKHLFAVQVNIER